MALEVMTVAEDEAVLFDGDDWTRLQGLEPDTEYTVLDTTFRTLPRPPGSLLATIATVNDVHFGETECGIIEGLELGPVFEVGEGEAPYPEVMNRAAVVDIGAINGGAGPDAVVVKGDLTSNGTVDEYEAFLAVYGPAFGARLHHVRGNHDAYHGATFAAASTQEVTLPGVVLAILDTALPGHSGGRVLPSQIAWLDDVATRAGVAGTPVLLFGHHHPWDPASATREATYFGINPDDSEALVALVARRSSIVGYFAGHTHRNRVRRFAPTGPAFPWVEVACVKDFPGAWAEYRVFEGGILQIHRRITGIEALGWTERTRGMFGGIYPSYALGGLEDRCFAVPLRTV